MSDLQIHKNLIATSSYYCGFHITFADCIWKFLRYFRTFSEAWQIYYVIANELANFIMKLKTSAGTRFANSEIINHFRIQGKAI